MSAVAGSGAAVSALPAAAAARKEERPFAGAPLKMAAPPQWFRGDNVIEQLEDMAAWGFPAYEWLTPPAEMAPRLKEASERLGVVPACILGAGGIAPGQMVLPGDHDKVERQFRERIAIAKTMGCSRLIGLTGNERPGASHEEQTDAVIACLTRLAPIAEGEGVTLVLEALNTAVDHAGYFLRTTPQTMAILEAVGSPNVKMLFDIYHQQITEGNVIRNLRDNIGRIGHFHVADNPGRHEPGTGELNYANIFKAIDATGYEGYVALELGPSRGTEAALQATLECLGWQA